MKTALLVVLGLGLLNGVLAQSAQELIQELPQCALNCIFQSLPNSGCSVTDISCLCNNEQLWANVTACVEPSCAVKDALTAQRISADTCGTPVRDRHVEMEVTSPVLAGVSLLLVIIRLIVRRPAVSGANYAWDDIIIVTSFLFGFPLAVIQYFLGKHGLGRDIWMVDFDDITQVLKLFYLAEVFYLASTTLTKISILFFYLRVFTSYTFRWVVWGVIGACTAFFISIIFPLVFQCRPVSYAWTRWDNEHTGTCINIAAGVFSHAAINMALDLLVLGLPIPLLYKLQLTYSIMGKIRIFIMFSFGLVVTIISALRLQTLVAFLDSKNPTYDFFGAGLWSALEVFIGIICACLPAAKVFFFRVAPKWVGLSSFGTSRAKSGPNPQRASNSWVTDSRASSANRLSKPPQRVSATISAIPEESEFLPLQGIDSDSQRISWVVTGKAGLPIQKFESPRTEQGEISPYDVEHAAASNKSWPLSKT